MKVNEIVTSKQVINFSQDEVVEALVNHCKGKYMIPEGSSIELKTNRSMGVEMHLSFVKEISKSFDL